DRCYLDGRWHFDCLVFIDCRGGLCPSACAGSGASPDGSCAGGDGPVNNLRCAGVRMSDMSTTAYRAGGKQGVGKHCAVAAGHRLAVRAAEAMLEPKRSGVDVAIAAVVVMGVVAPMATGIGGDLLAVIASPDSMPVAYSGSGAAPLLLKAEHVQALSGVRIPE